MSRDRVIRKSLAQRVLSSINSFERVLDFLCEQRVRISSTVSTVEYEARKVLVENFAIYVLFTHFDSLIHLIVQFLQKRYTILLHQYFQSVHDSLESLRLLEEQQERKRVTTTTTMDTDRIVEYMNLLFGGNQAIMSLIKCLVSVENFEESLVPFSEPVVREIGFIKWCVKLYTLHCPLDVQVFGVLVYMKREEMYPSIRKRIHENVPMIKFAISIIRKALECHSNPTAIAEKLATIWPDVYGLCLNIICQWLLTLNGQDIQGLLNILLKNIANFRDEVPQMLAQWKQQVAIERESNMFFTSNAATAAAAKKSSSANDGAAAACGSGGDIENQRKKRK
jgi:hypothetical protein